MTNKMKKQQLQRILDALETSIGYTPVRCEAKQQIQAAIDEVKAELAKPEQEPDAWRLKTGHGVQFVEKKPECYIDKWKALYTDPPEREALSDDEIKAGIKEYGNKLLFSQRQFFKWGVRFAERKHNIGTTAQPAQE